MQAVLIPPSHNAVLYSLAAGGTISVASLFLAGVLPGLLFGACVMGLCVLLSYRRGYPKGQPVTLRQAAKIAVEANAGRACPSTEARASASTKKPRRTGRRVLVMAGASHA